jgi:predicted ATP-dependent endonuclease of OLD family
MKLAKLSLTNFRGYQRVDVEFDENFNVIIGRNDVGKSTILEALEIFFNNETIKVDIDDYHVHAKTGQMAIQASFTPEDKLYTIDTVPTNLAAEYLLDKNGLITIKKVWDCSKDKLSAASLKTHIVANYPNNFESPLINEKITDLKRILTTYSETINVEEVKKNKSSEIRKAIYGASEIESFSEIDINIDKEDGKEIWASLKNDLPLFFIFQADRQNKDSDKEVQDPLKAITKSAISQLEVELEEVKNQIKIKAEEIGRKTLEKLKEMNPEIAEILVPEMSNKPWESLFSFSFSCDDGIPINKRGSGVRRLILLNYFRAEAERQNTSSKNIIYAIEEPETSQHPDWQVELFNALMDLSKNSNTQVITTTHSPSLAGLAQPSSIIFIHRKNGKVVVEPGNKSNIADIASSLGLLPDVSISFNDIDVKVILCVEGPTDVEFFNNISKLFDIDIPNNPEILTVSLGGGTLHHWVNKNYLRKLNRPEVHIYDNDVKKYKDVVDEINKRENSWATSTKMYEIENYIHPDIIPVLYNIDEKFIKTEDAWLEEWKEMDISKTLSIFLKKIKAEKYKSLTGEGPDSIKKALNERGALRMTVEYLKDLDAYDEVKGWFDKIAIHLTANNSAIKDI